MPNILIMILLILSSMVAVVGSGSEKAETKENAVYASIFFTNMALLGLFLNVTGG